MEDAPYLPGLGPIKKQDYPTTGETNFNQGLSHKSVNEIETEDVFRGKSLAELRELVINCPACNQLGFYVRCAEHKSIPF
jgi:hypothetical protein